MGLKSLGVSDLELVVKHYGIDKVIGTKNLSTMIDVLAMKYEFLAFKLQASIE